MEIWKVISEDSNYSVSNLGNLINNNTKQKHKGNVIKGGYIQHHIGGKSHSKRRLIHRLVAIEFIPNPTNLPEVNHKDGNKKNNTVENLEWCSRQENINHAFETGLFKDRNISGERNGNSKLTNIQRKLVISDTRPVSVIAKEYNVTIQAIYYIRKKGAI